MITWGDFYTVMVAMVPLYAAMILAYGSVRWWALFSPEQCAGINRFVAVFAVPLLSFHFIATNNPYKMNLHFIAADTLQKIAILAVLAVISRVRRAVTLDWLITTFSLATLPNTLVVGIPVLAAMYGDSSACLMVQVVVLQCVIWYTLLLFAYEYRAAQILVMGQLPTDDVIASSGRHVSRIAPEPSDSGSNDVAKEICVTIPKEDDEANDERSSSPMTGATVGEQQQRPLAWVMTKLILTLVWRKLVRNPNSYSSLAGFVWSLIAFRWHIGMPRVVEKSISILSDAGLGMAMFSLGLFMALQPKIIACGRSQVAFSMAVRFIVGPAIMSAVSLALGLRGTLLRIAIVQAALPQGIVTFVFAKDYDVLPTILSTGVVFGMLISLPITLLYYIILGL